MNSKAPRPPRELTLAAAATFSMADFAQALEGHDYQFQAGQVVQGTVIEHSTQGVLVDIGGKSPAFLPLSEASLQPVSDLQGILPPQTQAEFVIIREQNNEGQVTLSRRRLQLRQVWADIVELQASGRSLPVRVTGLNKGGVLVNVQGLRGFIPRSQLSERRENLAELVGQTLEVGFLEVNQDSNKLVLSQRIVSQSARLSEFAVGQVVAGQIASIKPFGLFIDLGDGSAGLLHIKQISQKYIGSLSALFQVGQTLKPVVLEIDEMKGRISLSTRVLEKYPGEVLEQLAVVMEEAEERASKMKGRLG